jgi:ABC-type multidrug transport system ATPase subunit
MIEIDSITIAYGEHVVQKDFSLCVKSGEKIALNGSSGVGKSSVLASMLGFIVPCSGSVSINGIPFGQQSVWEIRKLMGFVPQEPDMGEGSVKEIIERPFSYKANQHLKEDVKRLEELLNRFLLKDLSPSKDVSELSGGEKQRVSLIVALLLDRPILLLDEISSALDPKCKEAVAEYLTESDQTIVLVTHDPVLTNACDRVVCLDDTKGGR